MKPGAQALGKGRGKQESLNGAKEPTPPQIKLAFNQKRIALALVPDRGERTMAGDDCGFIG